MSVRGEGTRILVVDDDREMLEFLSGQLGQRGFSVETAQSGGQAVEVSGRGRFDVVICDLQMPLMDGLACMESLTQKDPSLQVIMISGEATVERAVAAMKKGAYDFLQKPIRMENLFHLIEKAMLKHQMDSVTDLYEKSRDILSHLDIKELLEPAIRNAVSFFKADQGCWMSFEDSNLQIASGCGLEEKSSQEAVLALGRAAIDDPKHDSVITDTALHVTLVRNNIPAAVFLLKRPAGSEGFTVTELREASALAKKLLEIVETSRLRRTLDLQLKELRKTYGELEASRNVLAQKEKLAKLGELIARVAHELNQPLSVVLAYTNLLLENEKAEPAKRKLSLILEEAKRCSRMTSDILNYARLSRPRFRWVLVRTLAEEILQAMAPELQRENVRMRIDARDPSIGLDADAEQLRRALLNLLKNAVHATAGLADRRIAVEIDANAERVRLAVRDNGHGIPAETLSKIFEPYFTTKPNGEGTGLGLSIVLDIVQAHHGKISARSVPGRGSSFVMDLPVKQPDIDTSLDHAA